MATFIHECFSANLSIGLQPTGNALHGKRNVLDAVTCKDAQCVLDAVTCKDAQCVLDAENAPPIFAGGTFNMVLHRPFTSRATQASAKVFASAPASFSGYVAACAVTKVPLERPESRKCLAPVKMQVRPWQQAEKGGGGVTCQKSTRVLFLHKAPKKHWSNMQGVAVGRRARAIRPCTCHKQKNLRVFFTAWY